MLTSQVHRIAGVIMLLLVVVLVVAFMTAETPNTDTDEFATDFQRVVDDEVVYLIGQTMQILTGVLVALLGVALYTLYWVRSRFLSLVGLSGFLVMGVLFVASSSAFITVHDLANDLDAGTTIAAEAEVQEIGRALVMLGDSVFFLSLIFFALGLIGFGTVIAHTRQSAPLLVPARGEQVPPVAPAWLGWIAVAAGILYLLGWLSLAAEVFFFR